MDILRVRKTDLARNTSQIIRNVLRGNLPSSKTTASPKWRLWM